MSPNFKAVIDILLSLVPAGQAILAVARLIQTAQSEGRDITDAELAALTVERKKAVAGFLASTSPP